MATTDRKRKRETNEVENTTMETELNPSAQFPQINPSQLQVKIKFQGKSRDYLCVHRIKPMVFVKFQFLLIVIHH